MRSHAGRAQKPLRLSGPGCPTSCDLITDARSADQCSLRSRDNWRSTSQVGHHGFLRSSLIFETPKMRNGDRPQDRLVPAVFRHFMRCKSNLEFGVVHTFACSSNSARPVRRATDNTSGTTSNIDSTPFAIPLTLRQRSSWLKPQIDRRGPS